MTIYKTQPRKSLLYWGKESFTIFSHAYGPDRSTASFANQQKHLQLIKQDSSFWCWDQKQKNYLIAPHLMFPDTGS